MGNIKKNLFLLVCILFALFSFYLLNFILKDPYHNRESKYSYISVTPSKITSTALPLTKEETKLNISNIVTINNNPQNISDQDKKTIWTGRISGGQPAVITAYFPRNNKINKIFINFGYGRSAIDFTLEKYENGTLKKISDIKGNALGTFTVYDDSNKATDRIKLTISNAFNLSPQISDIIFYSARENDKLTAAFNNIFVWPRNYLTYYLYFFLILLLVMLSGSLVFRPFDKYFTKEEAPVFAFISGLIFIAISGFILVLFPFNNIVRIVTILAAILWLTLCFIYGNSSIYFTRKKLIIIPLLFSVFLINYLYLHDKEPFKYTSTQYDTYYDFAKTTDMSYGNFPTDFSVPYSSAKILLYDIPSNSNSYKFMLRGNRLWDRTLLFALTTIPFLVIFGDRYLLFELLSIVYIIPFAYSIFLLGKILYNGKVAATSVILLLFNHFLLFVFMYSQVKYISIIYLSLFYYFLIKYKKQSKTTFLYLSGLMIALAMLIHFYSVIFFLPAIFYLFPNPLNYLRDKVKILRFIFIPSLVIAVFVLTNTLDNDANVLKAVIFGATNSKTAFYTVGKNKNMTNFTEVIGSNIKGRWLNIVGLFQDNPAPEVLSRPGGIYRLTIMASVLMVFSPFVLFGLFTEFKNKKREILLLIIAVFILAVLTNGFYTFFGLHWYLLGFIPLLVYFGAKILYDSPIFLQLFIIITALFEWYYVTFLIFVGDVTMPLKELLELSPRKTGFYIISLVLPVLTIWVILLIDIFNYELKIIYYKLKIAAGYFAILKLRNK